MLHDEVEEELYIWGQGDVEEDRNHLDDTHTHVHIRPSWMVMNLQDLTFRLSEYTSQQTFQSTCLPNFLVLPH